MSDKTIVVLATLDTKGREAQYLRECIERRGHRALLVDTGVVGPPTAAADVPREEVAAAGGRPLAELLERPTREEAAPVTVASPAGDHSLPSLQPLPLGRLSQSRVLLN